MKKRGLTFLFVLLCLQYIAQQPASKQSSANAIFQTIDTISDVTLRNARLNQLLSQKPALSPIDRLQAQERIARNYTQLLKLDSTMMVVNSALLLAEEIKNDTILAKFHNIKGGAFYYLGKKTEALAEFERTVEIAHRAGFTRQEASTLSNIGAIHIDEKRSAEAEKALQQSIALHASIGNEKSANSLLAQRLLATLYFNNGEILKANQWFKSLVQLTKETNNPDIQISAQSYLAQSYAKLGNKKEAVVQFEEVLTLAKTLNNPDSEASVLLRYSNFHAENGDYKKALECYKEAWLLKKVVFEKQLASATGDAEVKYQTELANKEKEIAQLEVNRKDAELGLAEKKQQQQWWIILSLLFGISLILTIAYLILRSRKLKSQQALEKERIQSLLSGQEKERERIAKDLHDGIVQDLAAIKHKLQLNLGTSSSDPSLSNLLNDITRAGNEVRNISYQLMPLSLREFGLQASIESLFERTKLIHHIEYECTFIGMEERLDERMEVTIYRICQELIHNAVKHSQTKTLHALFKRNSTNIQINFEDNGIGFDEKTIREGIGLNSIKSRVEMAGGTIEKDFAQEQSGTVFYIKLPI